MMWTFNNHLPIYRQISDKMKLQIVSNQLQAGEKLPSVRDLAEIAGVNPNTIQRALSSLEEEGLVYSQGTTGRFVTEDQDLILQSRNQLADETLSLFVKNMSYFGYQASELPQVVEHYIKGV